MKFDCGCEITEVGDEDEEGDLHDIIRFEPCAKHRPIWDAYK